MSRSIFITATDTGAGKTWVTAHLLRKLLLQGIDAQALKPIASGILDSGLNEDVACLLDVQGNREASDINFHTYVSPVAPALAAELEHKGIQPDDMYAWIKKQSRKAELTLIEGVGGLMVPLQAKPEHLWLVSDWLEQMADADVMLVVPLRLGCMNQALLSCQCLNAINRAPKWIVFNDIENNHSGEETKRILFPFLQRMFQQIPEILCVQNPDDLNIKL